jgi:hypothetical protein
MIGFPLTEDNFMLYAAQNYDNTKCFDENEFFDDLKRFKYLKKLLKKYRDTGVIRERLILNHLIIIYNLFGHATATRMLFFKLDGYHTELKTFLIYLNHMPEKVIDIGKIGGNIHNSDIPVDLKISGVLREL